MSSEILKLFSERIKEIRRIRQLSQEDLADLCDIDRTYVGRLERMERNPSLEILYKLAKGLDIKLEELLRF